MAENVLRLEDVTMQFGGVVAVDNLSLEVNKGEIVALIGPNGAGKTTAFNCITGIYEPTNGRITLHDEVIAENYPQGKMKKDYKGSNNGRYTKVVKYTPDKITKRGVARTFQNIRLFKSLTCLTTSWSQSICVPSRISFQPLSVLISKKRSAWRKSLCNYSVSKGSIT